MMFTLICKNCGEGFEGYKNQKYCSQLCYRKARRGQPSGNKGKKYPKEKYPDYGMRGKKSWSKGLTKETDSRVAKISKTLKDRKISTKALNNMRKASLLPDVIARRSEARKRVWANLNPDAKTERIKTIKEAINRPKVRAKFKKSITITNKRPDVIARCSKAQKEARKRPEVIARWKATLARLDVKARRKKVMKEMSNRPEVIAKRKKTMALPKVKTKWIKNMKAAWEKRIESSGYPRNYLGPNFNFNSVYLFKALDKILHTRSRYGGTSAGEKKIGRYFVDCFNNKCQLIIEWMEDAHYDNDGDLSKKDIEKRKYITAKYPNYTYIIIRQSDWFENGNLTKEIAFKIVNHILVKIK